MSKDIEQGYDAVKLMFTQVSNMPAVLKFILIPTMRFSIYDIKKGTAPCLLGHHFEYSLKVTHSETFFFYGGVKSKVMQ